MKEEYFKEYSKSLGRDMEYKVYGDKGKPVFIFPPQNGRFFDVENFHLIDAISAYIATGKIFVIAADGIDGESFSAKGPGRPRIEQQEKWFHYIVDELYPTIKKKYKFKGKGLTTGCSMGGYHSSNFFFRRPDLFDAVISLSGLYEASFFFGDYMDDLVYDNSPSLFLPNMPADHPYLKLYRKSDIVLCTGQGAWEEDMIRSTRNMDKVLREKNIPAWVDYWGFDVNHDWPWWQKQLPYFLSHISSLK